MTLPYQDKTASHLSAEAKEVAQRYARRAPVGSDGRYSMLNADVWLGFQERNRTLIGLLSSHVRKSLDELKVLEIGCGTGRNLLELILLGFNPENLTGNELLPERVAVARRKLPVACSLLEGDASKLDFSDGQFDIVYQSTVFTSLLDKNFQKELASRMWQWTKPGGGILWYDFIYNNPNNVDVRGVTLKRVRQLFPEGKLVTRRVTLAPPISRRVSRIHPYAYHLFNAVPWLRTHVLCWIGKEK